MVYQLYFVEHFSQADREAAERERERYLEWLRARYILKSRPTAGAFKREEAYVREHAAYAAFVAYGKKLQVGEGNNPECNVEAEPEVGALFQLGSMRRIFSPKTIRIGWT
jgi:hypothetical protein